MSLRFHSQPRRAASKRCNDNVRSPAVYENAPDSLSGPDFVTFDPYFKELNELLDRQWLITYRSANTGSGFRRIEVTTDYELHLHHPAGYRLREDEH